MLYFPVNDDTKGKDTEEGDTSSCNGSISREVEAQRGSAHPHQAQPHPSSNPANALDATN